MPEIPILKIQELVLPWIMVGLNKVLEEIESQTDYLFIYNSQINVNKLVTINGK